MKIYLAGPDVFREKAVDYGRYLKQRCKEYGHEGLFPLDNDFSKTVADTSKEIYQSNIELIKQADVVLANVTPFRGPSLDPGTAWEMGYGAALGKLVIGYNMPFSEYKTRVPDELICKEFPIVEDFEQYDNLMIVYSARKSFDTMREALGYINALELH